MSGPKKILAIDDDPDLLSVLKYSLELYGGFDITTVLGGLKGCQEAEAMRYDVIISDLIMPEIDGEMVVRRIRNSAKNKDTIIFLLTGNADVGEALQMERVHVVSKPIDPQALSLKIVEVWNDGATNSDD